MQTLKTPHLIRRRSNRIHRAVTAAAVVGTLAALPTSAGATAPVDSAPDESAPVATEPLDPTRQAWADYVAAADPDTFAGGAPAAGLVESNRVVVIGDSLMASTARRYGGEMCKTVTPFGWDVAVDAEAGRFIDFGRQVVDVRADQGFDVAVVMLGNNYGFNPDVTEEYYRDLVADLAPRPTVLVTVGLYKPRYSEVNDIIYDIADEYDNVRVLDWATEVAEDPTLIAGDGLHLSDSGRARLTELVADELGEAPGWQAGDADGECLSSPFTDDSAVLQTIVPVSSTTTTTVVNTAPTTTRPPATTRPATTIATTIATTTLAPATTPPPVTDPPTTPPPVTPPPATQPSTTVP